MASLLTIPQELIAHITQILYARTPHTGDNPAHGPNRVDVSQLSKTCRQLRGFGQAELFTSIKCQGDLVKAIRLVRALISRPELGTRVREITLSDLAIDRPQYPKTAGKEWLVTADDAAVLNEALRRFNVRSLLNEAREETVDGFLLAFQAVTKDKAPQYLTFEPRALAALAILHSPNTDHVALNAHEWTLPRFATPTGTFDNLAEITWEPGQGGESTTIDTRSLGWLLSAAPNLKRFYGFVVSDVYGGCSHAGVTDVVMRYCSLSSGCFSAIVDMFPNMTSFTYSADTPPIWSSEPEATPSEVIDAMLPLRDTLAALTLDFHFSPAVENCDWDSDEMSLSKLSQMVALRHLSITAGDVVWDDHSDVSATESEEEGEDEAQGSHAHGMKVKPVKETPHVVFLRSIMPPNLETLHLSSIPREFSMMPFADIAAISYPSLKTIYMGDCRDDLADDLDVVKAYFKERGILIEREALMSRKLQKLYTLI